MGLKCSLINGVFPMKPEKLVMMANQIAAFFKGQPGGRAAFDVADHLNKFWDPVMRSELKSLPQHELEKLDEVVLAALNDVKGRA